MHDNDEYITRFDGAQEIVTKMDVKIFIKHYEEHKGFFYLIKMKFYRCQQI